MALCRRRKFNLVTKNCTKNKYKKKHHMVTNEKRIMSTSMQEEVYCRQETFNIFFRIYCLWSAARSIVFNSHMKTDSLESLNVENYANFLGSPAAQTWKTCHIPLWPLKLLNASLLQAASLNPPMCRLPNLRPPFENAPRPWKNERTSH